MTHFWFLLFSTDSMKVEFTGKMKREDQAEAEDFQKCKSDNFEDGVDNTESGEQEDSNNENEEEEDEDDEDLEEEEGDEPEAETDGKIDGTAKEKSLSKEKKIKLIEKSGGKVVPGIIYLGHIPPRLRPKHLRNLLSVYGEIGRIFLQPEGMCCALLSHFISNQQICFACGSHVCF